MASARRRMWLKPGLCTPPGTRFPVSSTRLCERGTTAVCREFNHGFCSGKPSTTPIPRANPCPDRHSQSTTQPGCPPSSLRVFPPYVTQLVPGLTRREEGSCSFCLLGLGVEEAFTGLSGSHLWSDGRAPTHQERWVERKGVGGSFEGIVSDLRGAPEAAETLNIHP
ncbi:unnamed protein product [Pleuronectes platessa]|uniref:Uncharacterized protein n=1 Tax=Pleuronectes platessa TaxID=8262 RepID=A0A9N7V1W4_PLEPL|nr:unnamed protein product [Pleuronectes platessa]